MSNAKPGLTIKQIDAITMEICRAESFAEVVRDRTANDDDTGLFMVTLLEERLEKIRDMVRDCQIGGRHE